MAFDPRLAGTFLFDNTDLVANRGGRLSPEQALMFRNTAPALRRRATRVGWFWVPFLIALSAAVTVAAWKAPGSSPTAAMIAGGICFGFALLVLAVSRAGHRHAGVYVDPVVHTCEGRIEVRSDVTQTWYAHIGSVRFGVDRLQAEQLWAIDGVYRVYYIETGRNSVAPLSIDVISAPVRQRV